MSKTYAVVRVESGILEGVTLFEDREEAVAHGYNTFVKVSGDDSLMLDNADYDPYVRGVVRGYVMHWWTDDVDVWVTEPDITVGQVTTVVGEEGSGKTTAQQGDQDARPLCPFCRNGAIEGERYEAIVGQLGRDTIEAVLESIDFAAVEQLPLCPGFRSPPSPCPLTLQACHETHRHTEETS
jgi:hypothetical protein